MTNELSQPEGGMADEPVVFDDIWRLGQAGVLGAASWRQAFALIRSPAQWRRYLEHALMGLGVLHLLAGVVFFFAFNWADMTSLHKFAVMFTLLGLSFTLWWVFGPDTLRGQAAGAATTMMLGVLMAVFGQIYQTGADSWELFFSWTLLALPWMLVSRSAAHTLLWALVMLTAIHAYFAQVGMEFYHWRWIWTCFVVGTSLGVVLLALRMAGAVAAPLRTWWLEGTLQMIAILHFAFAAWDGAVGNIFTRGADALGFLGGLACLGLVLWLAIFRLGSKFAATLAFAGIASTLTVFVMRWIFDLPGDDSFVKLFLSGVVGVAGTAGFVVAIRPLLALVGRRAA